MGFGMAIASTVGISLGKKETENAIYDTWIGYSLSVLVQIMTSALQGAGDTKFPMYSTFIGIWGIRLGIGYVLAMPLNFGLKGIWYAYALDLTVRGVILLIRFRQGQWKNIQI